MGDKIQHVGVRVETKGERDQFGREKGPNIVYSGQNMRNTCQNLKAGAKIWKIAQCKRQIGVNIWF